MRLLTSPPDLRTHSQIHMVFQPPLPRLRLERQMDRRRGLFEREVNSEVADMQR